MNKKNIYKKKERKKKLSLLGFEPTPHGFNAVDSGLSLFQAIIKINISRVAGATSEIHV
jgi:hypothetical protein